MAQKLPETEISGAPTEVAGKGSDARTALAKNGMRGAGQLPYLGNFDLNLEHSCRKRRSVSLSAIPAVTPRDVRLWRLRARHHDPVARDG